jgi:hypothetical protein
MLQQVQALDICKCHNELTVSAFMKLQFAAIGARNILKLGYDDRRYVIHVKAADECNSVASDPNCRIICAKTH